MATKQDILDLINAEIIPNGSNQITAAVLNPVLIAMVGQINDLAGDPANLPYSQTTIIGAVNSVDSAVPSGIVIRTGTSNPNVVAPPTFALGDFYNQTSGGNTVAWYQWNGNDWVEFITPLQAEQRTIFTVNTSYSFVYDDNTIVYIGTSPSDIITIPVAANASARIIEVLNRSANNINFNISYQALDGTAKTTIPKNSGIELQSDGTSWYET